MLNTLHKKREPVAETEQETSWKCPRCPRTVQSRTDPSTKLFKPNMQSFENQDASRA